MLSQETWFKFPALVRTSQFANNSNIAILTEKFEPNGELRDERLFINLNNFIVSHSNVSGDPSKIFVIRFDFDSNNILGMNYAGGFVIDIEQLDNIPPDFRVLLSGFQIIHA